MTIVNQIMLWQTPALLVSGLVGIGYAIRGSRRFVSYLLRKHTGSQ